MNRWQRIELFKARSFMTGAAGKIYDMPQRTVQRLCEFDLIESPTLGTGDKRQLSFSQVVEIGVVRLLRGIPQKNIKGVLSELRRQSGGDILELCKRDDTRIVYSGGRVSVHQFPVTPAEWVAATYPAYGVVYLFSLTQLIDSVMDRLE